MSERPQGRAARRCAAGALQRTTRSPGGRPDRVAAWAFALGDLPDPGRGDDLARRERRRLRARAAGARRRSAPRPRPSSGERMLQRGQRRPGRAHPAVNPRAPGATATSKATGRFDSATSAAVRRFQREAGLADGRRRRARRRGPKLLALMRLSAGDLVRARAVRQPHGLWPAPAALDARRRARVAALRHSGDLLPRRALRDRAGDRPRPVPPRRGLGPHRGRREGARHGRNLAPAHDSLIRGHASCDVFHGAAPAARGRTRASGGEA